MARLQKFHQENINRVRGTSLCGHVAYFSDCIKSKADFDRLPENQKCKRCLSKRGSNFIALRLRTRSSRPRQYID